MRTLYLDCGMGAAGDMLMAALLELVDDKAAFLEKMNGLGLPGRQMRHHRHPCGGDGTRGGGGQLRRIPGGAHPPSRPQP